MFKGFDTPQATLLGKGQEVPVFPSPLMGEGWGEGAVLQGTPSL
jgi:hypothetical protein